MSPSQIGEKTTLNIFLLCFSENEPSSEDDACKLTVFQVNRHSSIYNADKRFFYVTVVLLQLFTPSPYRKEENVFQSLHLLLYYNILH